MNGTTRVRPTIEMNWAPHSAYRFFCHCAIVFAPTPRTPQPAGRRDLPAGCGVRGVGANTMAQWQKNLYALWGAQFISMVGLTLVVPFMPLYIGTLGVHRLDDIERLSGILFAAPFLAQTLIAPLWGVLGDRYGRKIMVLRALAGIGLTNMLAAAVGAVWKLLVLRMVQGAVSGFVAATNALVSSSIPRDRLGTAMGILQSSLTAGGIIGPLIGGALADEIGYRWVFVITGLSCWAGTAVVLVAVKEPPVARRAERGPGV